MRDRSHGAGRAGLVRTPMRLMGHAIQKCPQPLPGSRPAMHISPLLKTVSYPIKRRFASWKKTGVATYRRVWKPQRQLVFDDNRLSFSENPALVKPGRASLVGSLFLRLYRRPLVHFETTSCSDSGVGTAIQTWPRNIPHPLNHIPLSPTPISLLTPHTPTRRCIPPGQAISS
jgi:hypothetical protein